MMKVVLIIVRFARLLLLDKASLCVPFSLYPILTY